MIKLKDGFEGTLVDTVVKDYNKTNEAARKEWEAKEKALFLLMRDCLHSHNVVRNDIYWKLHKILKTEECSESLNRHSIAQGE